MDKTFEQYPNLKEYFTTSDGEKFYNENTAQNHAKGLKDREVKHMKRETTEMKVVKTEGAPAGSNPKSEFETLADELGTLGVVDLPNSTKKRKELLAKMKADIAKKASEEAKGSENPEGSEDTAKGSEDKGSEE